MRTSRSSRRTPRRSKKLIQDLKPLKNDLDELPVLIIDDESDQASVDTTNPAKWKKGSAENRKRTTINELITEILEICKRAQYVGYTATPFANVFVDPDDERDLFPADFVLSLHRPPGYMGVQEFHDVGKRWDDEEKTVANSNELAHVRPLVGDKDTDPIGRIDELQEALDAWVLSGAIKKFREAKSRTSGLPRITRCSSTSRSRMTTTRTRPPMSAPSGTWPSSTRPKDSLGSRSSSTTTSCRSWMRAPLAHPSRPSFDDLKPYVGAALAQITVDGDPVLIVNSDKEIQAQQKKLDFEADKVWRILVGGTQLSRGSRSRASRSPTSAGRPARPTRSCKPAAGSASGPATRTSSASTSVATRKSTSTRPSRRCSWMRRRSEPSSASTPGSTRRACRSLEPRQIPPLVSQHLPWLKPTARNKMWNAVIANKATAGVPGPLSAFRLAGMPRMPSNWSTSALALLKTATQVVSLPYARADGATGTETFKVGVVEADEFLKFFASLLGTRSTRT